MHVSEPLQSCAVGLLHSIERQGVLRWNEPCAPACLRRLQTVHELALEGALLLFIALHSLSLSPSGVLAYPDVLFSVVA